MNKRIKKKVIRNRAIADMTLCYATAIQTMLYPEFPGEDQDYDVMAFRFFKAIEGGDRPTANDVLLDVVGDIKYVFDTDDTRPYPIPSYKVMDFMGNRIRRIISRNKKLAGDGLTIGELRNLFPDYSLRFKRLNLKWIENS